MTSDYPLDEDGNYSQMLAKKRPALENNLNLPVIQRAYGIIGSNSKITDSNKQDSEQYVVKYLKEFKSLLYGNNIHSEISQTVSEYGLGSLLNALERNQKTKLLGTPKLLQKS